jgi:hypothetical protein
MQIADRCAPVKVANSAENSSANCLQDISLVWTTQKTQSLYCCRGVFTAPVYSRGRCTDHIENTALPLSRACMLRALPSNGHCLPSHCFATGLFTTICFPSKFYIRFLSAVTFRERKTLERVEGDLWETLLLHVWGETNRTFVTLKVPRKWTHLLLVKADWREGKALGSDEGRAIGSGLISGYVARSGTWTGSLLSQGGIMLTQGSSIREKFLCWYWQTCNREEFWC